MKTEKNICPNCETEFILGRSDQKYCNPKCRSRYHNKNNVINLEIVKKTNKLLISDYKIFLALLGGETELDISYESLRVKGPSLTRLTRFEDLNDDGNLSCVLYDICFFKTQNNNYKIIRL